MLEHHVPHLKWIFVLVKIEANIQISNRLNYKILYFVPIKKSNTSGASVDILMLSLTRKPFCYGEPSPESITKTSLNDENPSIEEELMKLKILQQNEKKWCFFGWKACCGSTTWKFEDVKNFQYDQVKEIDKSLVVVANKLINNVLKNGGELNRRGMCTSSN